ncbi:hypothetical protein Q7P36_011065 [Cladosporium allicinum]
MDPYQGNLGNVYRHDIVGEKAWAHVHHSPLERPEAPPNPLSTVPFRQDSDYVQRGSLIEEIDSRLSQPAARAVLVGLGGIGKSQLAIEYAHQLRRKSPKTWVLWVHASNAARFEQSVRDNLDQLKVRGRKDPKENVFQLLHDWLSNASNGPWLVVLDNADDARVLLERSTIGEQAGVATTRAQHTKARLEYLPQCDHGKVLITSRTKEVAKELVYWKDIVAVEPMNEEQALSFLRRKMDTWYTEEYAPRLARELDFMPLALAQAAAYICQSDGRCSIQQYLIKLEQCDKSQASVLDMDERDLRRDLEASNSIMLTWQISFNHIREVRPSATDLLSLMSFFDRQAIPQALLHEKASPQAMSEVGRREGTWMESTGVDSEDHDNAEDNVGGSVNKIEEFTEDLIVLRNYDFVSLTTDPTIFEMRRLVQLATKKWLKANNQLEHWGSQFISNLDDGFPTSSFHNWEICRSLFPHTIMAFHTEVTGQEAVLRQASLLLRSGQYASATGAYSDAERMEEQSFNARKRVLGAGHPDTLRSMNNLAMTYWQRGRWGVAETLQVEVMKKYQETLGENHPDTLTSIGNLAHTYLQHGRWEEAEKLQEEVVEKRKEVLGEGHPDTLTSINNLAGTYSRQGRWEQAEKLQVGVIEKRKEVLGEGHPDTLTSINNLAGTHSRQGRWEEAEKLQVEVMQKRKEVLGEGHPDTLTSINNLAGTYSRQGRWEEAEKLQVEVMQKRKEVLGEGHPDTLTSINNLAGTYSRQGRWEEAEELQVVVTEKSKEVLGEGHPDTLGSMNNLSLTYSKQGRWEEAERLQVEVVEKRKELLGEGHPSTLTSMNNLAHTYSQRGRWEDTEKLQVEVMQKRKEWLGEGHPDTLTSINNLAGTYSRQGRWEEAEKLRRDVKKAMESTLQAEQIPTVDTITREDLSSHGDTDSVSRPDSIFSIGSISTTSPSSTTLVDAWPIEQFVNALFLDGEIRLVNTAAFANEMMDYGGFQRNFRRLVVRFGANLRLESSRKEQRVAGRLLQLRAADIAGLVADTTGFKMRKERFEQFATLTSLPLESVHEKLARTLENPSLRNMHVAQQPSEGSSPCSTEMAPSEDRESVGSASATGEPEDDELEGESFGEFASLRDFILKSQAYQDLKDELVTFVCRHYTKRIESVLRSISGDTVEAKLSRQELQSFASKLKWLSSIDVHFSYQEDQTRANSFKALVEDTLGESWDWWPFDARARSLPKGYGCGEKRYADLPGSTAQSLQKLLRPRPPWVISYAPTQQVLAPMSRSASQGKAPTSISPQGAKASGLSSKKHTNTPDPSSGGTSTIPPWGTLLGAILMQHQSHHHSRYQSTSSWEFDVEWIIAWLTLKLKA